MKINKYDIEKLIDQALNNQVSNFTFDQTESEAKFTFIGKEFLSKFNETEDDKPLEIEHVYLAKGDHGGYYPHNPESLPIRICIEKQIRINALTIHKATKSCP